MLNGDTTGTAILNSGSAEISERTWFSRLLISVRTFASSSSGEAGLIEAWESNRV